MSQTVNRADVVGEAATMLRHYGYGHLADGIEDGLAASSEPTLDQEALIEEAAKAMFAVEHPGVEWWGVADIVKKRWLARAEAALAVFGGARHAIEPSEAKVNAAADVIARARGYVQGACPEEHFRDARAALNATSAATDRDELTAQLDDIIRDADGFWPRARDTIIETYWSEA